MASASLNKVMLIGNLGRDPEIKYLPNGTTVATFSVATEERRKDKDEKKVEWHNITCFGKQAEVVGEYLCKGSRVYVEGRIQTDTWEDKDGNRRKAIKIILKDLQMLGGTRKGKENETEAPFDDEVPF